MNSGTPGLNHSRPPKNTSLICRNRKHKDPQQSPTHQTPSGRAIQNRTPMRNIIRATAFIDWDTARRSVNHEIKSGRTNLTKRSIQALQESLAALLSEREKDSHFRVNFRLYHGWHRGKTKTDDRLELERCYIEDSPQRSLHNVSFTPELSYGDELLCGGLRCKILDTLRRRPEGHDEQKMVDTALVSDLLQFVHSRTGGLAIVVGDDDDLLPGIFTAEAWGGKVLVARFRTDDNRHLETRNLIGRLKGTP